MRNDIVLVAMVVKGDEVLSENHFFFVYPKDLDLKKGKIEFSAEKTERGYMLTFTATDFAKEVFLSTEDGKGFFTNNFFDLIPGKEVTTEFIIDADVPDVQKTVQVYSLVDSY